ncbi:MAG: SDR family oxidoreductase [Promethearchaeota archaeon]|jgi:NAD(P)-dependent dehydrogenase (short-subunit alcohol dehydrogenase family)
MEKKFFDNLCDKTVIVAGGNGLIGSAIVRALEFYGADVVCTDIRGEGKYFNVAEPESMGLLLEKYFACNAFVNCAYPKDLKTATESWLKCTEIVAKSFSRGGGSIVNFGSIYGVVGSDMSLYDHVVMTTMNNEYAGVKGFIISASRNIACEFGKYDVRCNVVSPGGVFDNQPVKFEERYSRKVPLGRMALPHDIVGTVLFLVSDWSEYITGQNFLVDGGLTAQC